MREGVSRLGNKAKKTASSGRNIMPRGSVWGSGKTEKTACEEVVAGCGVSVRKQAPMHQWRGPTGAPVWEEGGEDREELQPEPAPKVTWWSCVPDGGWGSDGVMGGSRQLVKCRLWEWLFKCETKDRVQLNAALCNFDTWQQKAKGQGGTGHHSSKWNGRKEQRAVRAE